MRLIICNAFFAPWGSPLYRLYGYVRRQRVSVVFKPFWSETGYQLRPFWSEIGYGLCPLVLNWVCKGLSRAGLQGFRSEIGCQIFAQVWNRVREKSQILVWNRVRVTGSGPHIPTQFFWKYPPGIFVVIGSEIGGSLCQAFLADTVETGTKNRCVMEATHV